MKMNRKPFAMSLLLVAMITFAANASYARGGEYDQIVRHLKTRYQAKKVKIPFMWLARFAVKVVRPAGVKSISVTLFENLKFGDQDVDRELQSIMRESFGAEWQPILRVRSRNGEQAYMYMRESGEKSIKIAFLSVDKGAAAVIRATVDPDKLAEFMNDPKVFGVSIGDGRKESRMTSPEVEPTKP